MRSGLPARSRARLACSAQDLRVFSSHSTGRVDRLFSAPPRSGCARLCRLNQVSGVRSRPSFIRSEIIRWQCGLSGFPGSSDRPRWIAKV